MADAWITLQCPECRESWEADPTDLPAPADKLRCDNCAVRRPTSEFTETSRDLEILAEFQES